MSKIRILVAEDEKLVAKDIDNMLRGLGYEVLGVVARGEDAVARAGQSRPDLVLMDIVLKGELDGIQAAETIWESWSIPVIYLTAYADDRTFERAKVTEPFGYILKPFDDRELQTTIEMAFYKAGMDRKLREREEWLSTVLRSIGDGVIATDEAGRVTFMNTLAEKLTGWSQEEALTQSLERVFSCGGLGAAGENRLPVEAVLASKAGPSVPIEHTTSPIRGERAGDRGRVFVFRDISSRKRAEEELRESWTRLQKALAGTVEAMALTIEMRDPYTAGHQRRVSRLSCAIAQDMGLPLPQIEGLRVAGDIHDVGKIYVPAEILSKPGRLNEIETSIIWTHARVGFDILRNIDFPWPIAQIIYQHHERLDGSGYPAGLKDGQILLEARILAVADVIEAISSHRPYRPSFGLDRALQEVRDHSGELYDSAVTEACLRLFEEKRFAFE